MTTPSAGTATSRVSAALEILRARGMRVTEARRAVITVLDGTEEHLDADEVARRAEQGAPGLHRTTVYRALTTLGDLGLVSHTHVGGAATVHHLCVPDDPAQQSVVHAHAQCTSCQAVFDVPVRSFRALSARLLDDLDFELQPEHAALLGRCARCRS